MTDPRLAAPSPRGLETWRTFLQAHATVVRRLEADLDEAGQISLADLDVLFQLASADGRRLRMSELADTVLLSRSGMTRRIDRLEAAGLVQRHECAADRRGAFAAHHGSRLERLQRARPTHLQGIEEALRLPALATPILLRCAMHSRSSSRRTTATSLLKDVLEPRPSTRRPALCRHQRLRLPGLVARLLPTRPARPPSSCATMAPLPGRAS